MKKVLIFSLLLFQVGCGRRVMKASLSSSSCTPPDYVCAYTGTAIVQTPSAPFSATMPVNTVVVEKVLSHAHISRVTSSITGGGLCGLNNQWNATPSGGSNDIVTSTDTSLVQITCAGGVTYVVGFNSNTLQVSPVPPAKLPQGSSCTGPSNFSRVDKDLWYCKPNQGTQTPVGVADGTTVYKVKFTSALVSPQWSKFFDFNTCPQYQPGKQIWYSLLGVGINDSAFSQGISYTGGQGTGHLVYYYTPSNGGCSTVDTQGDGLHPIYYNHAGTALTISYISATWFVHEVTTNGPWVQITQTNCKGVDCGLGNGPPVWEANTNNFVMFGTLTSSTGHDTFSRTFFYNANNPSFSKHLLTTPSISTIVGKIACFPCQDQHFTGDVNNDENPLLGTTGGGINATWAAPYKSEIFGISVDGSQKVFRYGKTYALGNLTAGFQPKYGIGASSQDRCTYFFTSDMLGNLGKTATGLNKWDVFAIDLCGKVV